MNLKKILLIAFATPFIFTTVSFAGDDKDDKDKSSYSDSAREDLEFKLYGNIKSFSLKYPSAWIIKDKKILVTKDTRFDEEHGKISTNSYVEVKGYYKNQTFVATKIEVRKNKKVKKVKEVK